LIAVTWGCAEQLSAEIEIGATKLADLKAQRDALMAKL